MVDTDSMNMGSMGMGTAGIGIRHLETMRYLINYRQIHQGKDRQILQNRNHGQSRLDRSRRENL